jgi:catechol-2,3-dioxygenase
VTAAGTFPVVGSVRGIELNVRDLERSSRFYTDTWALELVAESAGARYFRASGPEHHVLVLRAADVPGVAAVELAASNAEAVDCLYAKLSTRSTRLSKPGTLDAPGGGYGLSLEDRSGRQWRVSADVAQHDRSTTVADRPFKISHVVLNSADVADDVRFAIDDLGFRLRDESKSMMFLGCNADHHSLAFAKEGRIGLNHIAYEVPSIDGVMRNAGRLKRHGFPMDWGVGRHGPGANVYSYYLDPDGVAIEYTAEVLQVDDATYRPGTPADWDRPPFFDAWGLAEPPTQRFREAMSGELIAR